MEINSSQKKAGQYSKIIRNLALLLILAQFGFWQINRSTKNVHADSTAPKLYLSRGRQFPTTHKGSGRAIAAVSARQASALSLAAEDFDSDGYTDLAVGFAAPGGGLVAIHRGNIDAYAPQSRESFDAIGRGDFPSPYLPEAQLVEIPGRPDFLSSGDFIGQHGAGIVAATRGGNSLHVLARGDSGAVELLQSLPVQGSITAVNAHGLNNGKYAHLFVGVHTQNGSQLLVYRGSHEGLSQVASFALAGDASSFAFGNLDGDTIADALIVAGGKVSILHGASRTIQPVSTPYAVASATLGTFVNDRDSLLQISLLATDGSLHILAQEGIDSRPFTTEELRALRSSARVPTMEFPNQRPAIERAVAWKEVESFSGVAPASGSGRMPLMMRTRISSNGADDVMLLNSSRMSVMAHMDQNPSSGVIMDRADLALDAVAALPVRVNIDGRPGLVVMKRGETIPHILMPLPDPTFFVNRNDDPAPGAIASTCNNVSNVDVSTSCSLREAVRKANATGGTDTIMLAAGTYTLTIARNSLDHSSSLTGTLEVQDSVNIIGAGQATTIIQGGTNLTTSVDKVISFNQDIDSFTNATVSISNLTIQNGHNRGDCCSNQDGFGGAFDFDTGASGTQTLSVTNVTITNNQVFDGQGGGFTIFNTNNGSGSATFSNVIISNNSAKANGSGCCGDGGGGVIDARAKITITNATVTGNSTIANGSTNPTGGAFFFAGQHNQPQSAIHSSTITGNTAAGAGGGLATAATLLIDTGTIIANNVAGNGGQASPPLFGGGGILNDANDGLTLSKVTITGNSTTGNGGGIFTGNGSSVFPLAMNFSRLAGNTATVSGSNLYNFNTNATVTNDWWGTNTPSNTIAGTTTLPPSGTNFDPFIVLSNTANNNPLKIGQTANITASFLQDNHGTAISVANLTQLIGLPVAPQSPLRVFTELSPLAHGTLSAVDTLIQSTGTAAETYTAGSSGIDTVHAAIDQESVALKIRVLFPPSIAKQFGATHIAVGGTTSLTFIVTNQNTLDGLHGLAFTDTLPAGLAVAAPNGLSNTCNGTVTAVAGSSSVSLSGGTIAQAPVDTITCTVTVNVTGVADGLQNNTTGNITATDVGGLTGNTGSASITVINPPTILKAFGAATLPLNGTTSLTFTVSTTNANETLNGVAFTDTLPSGLVVATPNGLSSTCSGTATAVAGSGSVSLSGATLAPGPSCNISVNVTGTTSGVKNNSVTISSTDFTGLTGNTSNASVTVFAPPVIIKSFGAASIPLNGTTSLTFTIQNNNAGTALTGVGFTDGFPAGLQVSSPNGLTGSCGAGTITATAGSANVSLTGASIAGSSSCSFAVNVTGIAAGTQNNTTGNVTSTEGGTGGTASASVNVVAPPSIAKSFNPTTIAVNGVSTLTFTITNPSANAVALTGVGFTDSLPAGVVVSTPNGLSNTCGGTATATAGSGSISLSSASIATNSNCTVTVNVTGTSSGVKNNTTAAVTSTNGGTGNTASATLTVATPPAIVKAFGAASIPLNGTTSLTFTITNPNAGLALTGLAFTDTLPAGLVVATPNGLTNTCGGTATATSGAGSISLSTGTVASSSNCTVAVNVTGTTAGVKNNSVQVTSTEGGTGNTSNASITVGAPPVIIKAFGAASIPLGGSTSLTFTIQNNNTTTTLTGVGFGDTFPAGLVVATPNGLTGSCGGGSINATAGANAVSLSGGSIGVSTSCTFSINVTGTTAGTKNNTTGQVTSTEGGTGGTASASINVVAPPSIAKAFNPTVVGVGQTSTLTFTITNPAGNAVSLTGVAFTDVLPAGLTVVNTSTPMCSGTETVSGGNTISLAGATIAANTQCIFSVTVTATTSGVFNNVTGAVTSTNGGTGNTASASLTTGGSIGASLGLKSGPQNARVWPVIIGNNGPGTAIGAQVTSLTLQQTLGAACTPVISTPLPLVVGDIAAQANGTGNVTIDFTGCGAVFFRATIVVSANGGATTTTVVRNNQAP